MSKEQSHTWLTLIPPEKEIKRYKKLLKKGKINEENFSRKMLENSVEVRGQNINDDRVQSLNDWYNLFTKK